MRRESPYEKRAAVCEFFAESVYCVPRYNPFVPIPSAAILRAEDRRELHGILLKSRLGSQIRFFPFLFPSPPERTVHTIVYTHVSRTRAYTR